MLAITQVSIACLQSNDYNPNTMTEDEFAELTNEVRKLGRVPKPIVVRKNGNGFLIIDGEHNWKAAQEVGLDKVTCEVIEADDFEAMRQTYKRNQHGTHNPVRLGQMFQRMMKERGLSLRNMADEIVVSKDTINNNLLYAKAAEELKDEGMVDRLTVRQIRWYAVLPKVIGKAWLLSGANINDLTNNTYINWQISHEHGMKEVKQFYERIAENGLLDYLPWYAAHKGLKTVLKKVTEWETWESSWARGGIDRKELRKYTRWFFEKKWVVKEKDFMEATLMVLIDRTQTPPTFRLTSEEFEKVINDPTIQRDSHSLFQKRLKATIAQKTGYVVKDKYWSKDVLTEIELKEAPDYIKNCPEDAEFKYTLWKITNKHGIDNDSFEKAKQEIASRGFLYYLDSSGYDLAKAMDWQIRFNVKQFEFKKEMDSKSVREMAEILVNRLAIYDRKKEYEKWKSLLHKFAVLTKEELYVLNESIKYTDSLTAFVTTIKATSETINM